MIRMSLITLSFAFLTTQALSANPAKIVVKGHLNQDEVITKMEPKLNNIKRVCYEERLLKKNKAAAGNVSGSFTVVAKQSKIKDCSFTADPSLSDKKFIKCVKANLCTPDYGVPAIETEIEISFSLSAAP